MPGALLLLRGITDLPLRELTGLGAGRHAVYHQKEIEVQAPVHEVYTFWRQVENFPHIFSHVNEVRETGPGRTHWVVSGPLGTTFEFDAVTTELIPNELIAWQSTPESSLQNKGIVRFKEARAVLCPNTLAGSVVGRFAQICHRHRTSAASGRIGRADRKMEPDAR